MKFLILTWIPFAVHKHPVELITHLSATVMISHSSASDLVSLFLYLHAHTHNTIFHKQSSTLKQIPMRHITGSLYPTVCLLERYRLLQLCFLRIAVRKEKPSDVCVPQFILEMCVYACAAVFILVFCSMR